MAHKMQTNTVADGVCATLLAANGCPRKDPAEIFFLRCADCALVFSRTWCNNCLYPQKSTSLFAHSKTVKTYHHRLLLKFQFQSKVFMHTLFPGGHHGNKTCTGSIRKEECNCGLVCRLAYTRNVRHVAGDICWVHANMEIFN